MGESVEGQDFEEGKQMEDYVGVKELTKELDDLIIPGEDDKPVEQSKAQEKVEPKKTDPQPATSSSQDAVTMKIQTPPVHPPIQTPPIQETPKPAPTPQPIVEVKTSKDSDFKIDIPKDFTFASIGDMIETKLEEEKCNHRKEIYQRMLQSWLNPQPLPQPQIQQQTVVVKDPEMTRLNESGLRRIEIELMEENIPDERRRSLMKVKADLLGMPYVEEPLPTLKMQGPPPTPKPAEQPKIVDVKPKKKQREYGPKVVAAVFALSVVVGFAIFFVANMGH